MNSNKTLGDTFSDIMLSEGCDYCATDIAPSMNVQDLSFLQPDAKRKLNEILKAEEEGKDGDAPSSASMIRQALELLKTHIKT